MIVFDKLGKCGRLGNSLYQFAATLGLGRNRGDKVLFNADWLHRPYFSVPDEMFGTAEELASGIPAESLVPHLDPRQRVFLTDYRLFGRTMPLVRELLAPSPAARAVLAEQTAFLDLPRPIVAVHVRRGDYIVDAGVPDLHNYFPIPPLKYYMIALEGIRRMHGEVGSVAVFSDDIAWCERHLPADYYHHGTSRPKEHEPDYLTAPVLDWIDLQLIAQCEHHVLSASSYGVWGALLAADEHAIVPHPWFGPKLAHVDTDLQLPPTWTHLHHDGTRRC